MTELLFGINYFMKSVVRSAKYFCQLHCINTKNNIIPKVLTTSFNIHWNTSIVYLCISYFSLFVHILQIVFESCLICPVSQKRVHLVTPTFLRPISAATIKDKIFLIVNLLNWERNDYTKIKINPTRPILPSQAFFQKARSRSFKVVKRKTSAKRHISHNNRRIAEWFIISFTHSLHSGHSFYSHSASDRTPHNRLAIPV